MFKVPMYEDFPTFDDTFKVSFWSWLTSSKKDRLHWRDLRNKAMETSKLSKWAADKDERARQLRHKIMGRD